MVLHSSAFSHGTIRGTDLLAPEVKAVLEDIFRGSMTLVGLQLLLDIATMGKRILYVYDLPVDTRARDLGREFER